MTPTALLADARRGDDQAFERLVAPHRGPLLGYCYRMLGSLQDAEDALQDALLQAWRGLARFEGRSPFRSWLYAIATNACLKTIERRGRRVLPAEFGPPTTAHSRPAEPHTEPVWIEPYPDAALAYEQRESVELAFVAALQHLSPRQRAVLILRDVLGFSGGEVADALDASPAAVYSALQRAHKGVAALNAGASQGAMVHALGDARLRQLVDRYVAAWQRNDVDAIVGMLTADAVIAMPPRPTWFQGSAAVGAFLREWPLSPGAEWRLVPVGASGQVAFASYLWRAADGCFEGHAIDVVTLRGDRIAGITAFVYPELFGRFGLARTLPA